MFNIYLYYNERNIHNTREMYITSVPQFEKKKKKLAQKSISEDINIRPNVKNFNRSRPTTTLPNSDIIRNHDTLEVPRNFSKKISSNNNDNDNDDNNNNYNNNSNRPNNKQY